MLSSFFLNNWNKKMLAPHAVDIHSWNWSNFYLTMFHICRTIRRHFSLRQVKLCIGQRKYKQKFTTQGRKDRPIDRPTDQASEFALALLTPILHFCKIVVKMAPVQSSPAVHFDGVWSFNCVTQFDRWYQLTALRWHFNFKWHFNLCATKLRAI